MRRQILTILSVALVLGFSYQALAQTIVPNTSTWSYLHPTDGVDPAEKDEDFHTTFYQMDFDDSDWKKGQDKPGEHGGFGYGDEDFEGVDIGEPEDPDDRKTAYFRCRFTTYTEHSHLELRCRRDDGVIIYLDGQEVARDNMFEGEEAYDLRAKSHVVDEAETVHFRIPLEGITLPPSVFQRRRVG